MSLTKEDVCTALPDVRRLLVDERKWIKGEYTDHEGGFCFVGGFYSVLAIPKEVTIKDVEIALISHFNCVTEAAKAAPAADSCSAGTIEAWNDHPDRTIFDIDNLLDDMQSEC